MLVLNREMQAARASRTALGVAIRRACHQVHDSTPLVLDDPIAVAILGETYRQALEDAAASVHDKFDREMRAWLVARNRYAEDTLREAFEKGVRQYVLLGAPIATHIGT
jgi:O-methyltransferase involved in polyketide biosynthesis